ncbi:DUF927 domain-containing protein [Achromobacter sp. F4_2707]|uniref:DUF927 domain-containing protein n=1 Tax=Achromobacter sp. F4_2707 TaxID=3114286 RepID=UPI0039C69CB8
MSEAQVIDLDATKPVDPFPKAEERPCWRCYDDCIKRGPRRLPAGVYFHGMKDGSGDSPPTPTDTWVCGPLHIEAMTASAEDSDHGRLLHYRNVAGNWKRWAMPMQMLAGDGAEVLGVLLAEGLALDRKYKARILDYINSQHPKQRLRAAGTTGWHGGAFVLPDEVIGADDIWYQATERTAPYSMAGTLEGWKEQVAARAVGNPMLALSISSALAGVLLERLNIDGGGLHLFGDSSAGKTTALIGATSVWGGPAFRRTWRSTSNGLEGAAKMHTGTLLALDEVGEVNPRDLYESAYALINGHGKTRANVRGEARQVARWRVFVLSTGEVTIGSRMAAGGYEAKAGQALRLLDVPIVGTYGAWDDLHGYSSGAALSDAIRDGASQHYGHAGRAFVRGVIESKPDLPVLLEAAMMNFKAADGQESRAARVFALCAVAGELAANEGILPWPAVQAMTAALRGFELWREQRDTGGRNAEDAAILRRVADFIDRHGDSRFSCITVHEAPAVRDRAGYWKDTSDGRLYLFTAGGFGEAVKGYDTKRALSALDRAGAIAERDTGKRSKKVREPGGRPINLFHVNPEKLAEVQ